MNQDVQNDKAWYLIQCKPKQSFRAAEHLQNQGYTCFHPTHIVKRKVIHEGAGKIQKIITPLFPYYLFVMLKSTQSGFTIRSTRGVRHIVSFNGKPARVDYKIIEALQYHCNKLNEIEPEPLYKFGDLVRINTGCFKEIEAVVMANTGEKRITLLLNLFNREHKVDLDITAITACN